MKKLFLLLAIPVLAIAVTGCGQRETSGDDLSVNDTTMCANAIQDYLAQADLTGEGDVTVAKGHTVTVHYIGRLDDDTVFDTSIEDIAKACGKYSSERNYTEGLTFQVGAGQMIAGFDQGVEGMKVGQTKTIHIEAADAYGERSEANLIKIPKEQIPGSDALKKGDQLMASNGQRFTVYEIGKDEITLDANHELAGKKLIFDITVTDIQE